MVDAIKTTVNRLELSKGRTSDGRPLQSKVGQSTDAPASDTVSVSETASTKAHMRLAETPPVDMEAVQRIKDAIAKGAYPVDIDRISEALMDAYREMKG